MVKEFKNTPLIDFSINNNKEKMIASLSQVKSEFGKEYPLIIGGTKIKTDKKFYSYNPSNKDEVVGVLQQPDSDHVEQVINSATEAFKAWRFTSPEERAGYLFKSASIMRKKRFELSAWLVYEVGKNWIEADADIAEAIDFLEFYGREALRYGEKQPVTPVEGEVNELVYIPLGVGVVIAPWNFPMAILVGMTSASFVTGNTVVVKPSSDSPVIAYKFMEILEEAGVPPGVVNYFPGRGGVIGDALVTHPYTRFVTFTGSKEIGVRINELAAKVQPNQIWIKRVVAEMGGKDTIIIDENADLTSAVRGVIVSAFGYQGQKCSACSRAIVLSSVYDEFVDMLKKECEKIKVGDPVDPENYMGPVINKNAFNSILEYIEIGKKEGTLICGGNPLSLPGYFIEPTIIKDVKPGARIDQEEIFGPVLAVLKAQDFESALEIANSTIYGLTGSVYTKNRAHIERAKKIFHCGNLYFNRKCTGALVGGHPFGGFNMSGTDSKAGGRDYLLLFLQAKAMSEAI
jgi:1-pyrroline-5-carboxylate dehydrogenase